MLIYLYLLQHTHLKFECEQQYWEGFGMYLVHNAVSIYCCCTFFEVYQRRPVFDLVGGRVEVE